MDTIVSIKKDTDSLIMLDNPESWKHCHAIRITDKGLEVYNVFKWPDGHLQAGYSSCVFSYNEIENLKAFLNNLK